MTTILKRHNLIATVAGAFSAAAMTQARADVGAGLTSEAQRKKHFTRFAKLDTESLMDFQGGFIRMQKEYGGAAAHPEREAFVKSQGYSTGETDLSFEECHNILMRDPKYAAYVRLSRSIHEQMWARALEALNAKRDLYLSAMEATDKMGPGSLELNASLHIPEYATYEIHEQPGGYVGDAFAGMLYHYAMVTAFYQGLYSGSVNHDERNAILVARAPIPEDGKIKRILEVGCSDGRTTMALKERFPDAEVWGLDVAAPQVRYAHHRAAGIGLDIHFVQRLAEDMQFPDNHFDLLVTNLIFHECPAFATRKIVPEIHRVMRKGAVWHNADGGFGHPVMQHHPTIVSKAAIWVNHRYNNETWEVQWNGVNMFKLLQDTGFTMDINLPQWVPVKA